MRFFILSVLILGLSFSAVDLLAKTVTFGSKKGQKIFTEAEISKKNHTETVNILKEIEKSISSSAKRAKKNEKIFAELLKEQKKNNKSLKEIIKLLEENIVLMRLIVPDDKASKVPAGSDYKTRSQRGRSNKNESKYTIKN